MSCLQEIKSFIVIQKFFTFMDFLIEIGQYRDDRKALGGERGTGSLIDLKTGIELAVALYVNTLTMTFREELRRVFLT